MGRLAIGQSGLVTVIQLIAWMYCEERVLATYIVRSSGDSASPFGYSQLASTLVVAGQAVPLGVLLVSKPARRIALLF